MCSGVAIGYGRVRPVAAETLSDGASRGAVGDEIGDSDTQTSSSAVEAASAAAGEPPPRAPIGRVLGDVQSMLEGPAVAAPPAVRELLEDAIARSPMSAF